MSVRLPKVYPILDVGALPDPGRARSEYLYGLGAALARAGLTLLEYRNKTGTDSEALADARVLREALPANLVKLVMDDRVDVALAAGFDGVHVDAGDLPVRVARTLLDPGSLIGTSASSEAELAAVLAEPIDSIADYFAFGPVFPTTTKQTSAPLIGIEGVRRFRAIAGPDAVLVAAAGITLETASHVLDAGATSVAVSAAIFRRRDPAAEFARWIDTLQKHTG